MDILKIYKDLWEEYNIEGSMDLRITMTKKLEDYYAKEKPEWEITIVDSEGLIS